MVAVDTPNIYDLAALGHPAPIVLDAAHRRSEVIHYRVPAATFRRLPYARIALRARVRLSERTKHGAGYVTMNTGGGPSASVEILTSRRHGRLRIHWDSVDVVGEKDYYTSRRVFDVYHPNYVAFDDTGPGTHSLRFSIEQIEQLHFERVTISPRTSIRLTSEPPYPVQIAAKVQPRSLGKPISVVVTVRNLGAHVARHVTVDAAPQSGMRLLTPPSSQWGDLRPGRASERRISLSLPSSRPRTLALRVESSLGGSSGRLTVRPLLTKPREGIPTIFYAGVGGFLLAFAVWRLNRAAA